MTDTTPRLGLPLLADGQARQHVTHNDALLALDALTQCAVLDKDLAAPPGSPDEGGRYIVAASPSGAWAGRAGAIAIRQDGDWTFASPEAGFLAFVIDEGAVYVFDGVAWVPLASTLGTLQNLARLGIGTAADGTNPFAAKLNKALWTARGAAEGGDGDLRYTLNKESAADVLSLLFQTGFSGRAELGLIGDDALRLKVSTDGSTWREMLSAVPAAGALVVSGGGGSGTDTSALQVRTTDNVGYTFGQSMLAPALTSGNRILTLIGASLTANNAGYLGFQYSGGAASPTNALILGLFGHGPALVIKTDGTVAPAADAAQSSGEPANRWSVVYAASGTINTSDARDKSDPEPLSDAELAAAADLGRAIGTYRFLDALALKGAGARLHVGLTVQRAIAVMEAHGLDPFRYGFICHDSWDAWAPEPEHREAGGIVAPARPGRPAGDRYGLRLDELLLFIARGLDARLARIEASALPRAAD